MEQAYTKEQKDGMADTLDQTQRIARLEAVCQQWEKNYSIMRLNYDNACEREVGANRAIQGLKVELQKCNPGSMRALRDQVCEARADRDNLAIILEERDNQIDSMKKEIERLQNLYILR
jgi:hypothetical protein